LAAQLADGYQNIASAAQNVEKGQQGAAKGTRAFGLALKAAGIGLILAAITFLVSILQKIEPVTDRIQQAMAGLSGVIDEITGRVAMFGKGIIGIFKGEAGATDKLKASFTGLGSSIGAAFNNASKLEERLQKLNNAYKELDVEVSKQNIAIAAQEAILNDSTKSVGQRLNAQRTANAIRKKGLSDEITLLKESLDIEKEKAAATKNQRNAGTLTDGEAKAQIALNNALAEQIALDASAKDAVRSLREESSRLAKERAEKQLELNKLIDDFRKQVEALERGQLTGVARIRADTEFALDQLEQQEKDLRNTLGKKFNLEDEFIRARAVLIKQGQQEISMLLFDENQAELERLREQNERKKEIAEKEITDAQSLNDINKQIALARVDALRKGEETQEQFLRASAIRKLEIEEEYLRNRLALVEKSFGIGSKEAELIRAQIALIQQQYKDLGETDLSAFDALKQKILSALSLTENDLQLIGNQAQRALSAFTELADATTQQQIAQQDKLIAAIENRIERTTELLDIELERQRNGDANSVESLQEALQQQNQARAAAEAERARIEEKAARRRLIVNQAQAASEFVLATIKILSAEASKGVPGILIALSGIALVAKLVAQSRAAAASVNAQGFKDGVDYLEGAGNSISDSIPARLSRGERVLPTAPNEAIGGKNLTNEMLVKYVLLGKQVASDPKSGYATDYAAVPTQGQQVEATNLNSVLNEIIASNEKVVNAVKSIPIVYTLKDGTVVIEDKATRHKKILKPSK
jgi:hypothetical protein